MKAALRFLCYPLLCLAAANPAFAGDIEVKSPWARATVRAQTTSSAYMEIRSARGATLVGASSPVAGSVELHEMKMEGDVMKMRAVPRLAVPAGKSVTLTPSGYHLMLYELKGQLVPGTRVPIKLEFERGGKREMLEVSAEVRGLR